MGTSANIRFGSFVLNRTRGCVEDATGAERVLRPKSYRVLEVLAEQSGGLVSKDDLVLEAWPDVIVSDDSLAHCVSDIRRALGPEGADLIRTVPRRGYMLMAEQPSPIAPAPAIRGRHRFMAFALFGAFVVASTGLWWMPQPVSVELAEVGEDAALIEADALLKSRDWQRRADNEQARQLLEAILAKHGENADARASLGLTYWLEVRHVSWGGGRREMSRALAMVEGAVALGGSARAHRLLAEMRLLSPFAEMRSPVDALASARAAVAIHPDDPDNLAVLAHALALTGRAQEAVPVIEQARHMQPTSPEWYREIAGLAYLLGGQPARAVEEYGALHGSGTFGDVRWWPGWLFAASLAQAGRIDDATRVVHSALLRHPQANIAGVAQSFDGLVDGTVVLDGLRLAGLPG